MAEDFGFDSISVTDHVVMGKNLHKYPFGNFPLPSDSNWYEPLSILTMIASNTKKIKLATAILIAPLRSPALLAKTAATLDAISQGRLELGLAQGGKKRNIMQVEYLLKIEQVYFGKQLILLKSYGELIQSRIRENFEFEDIWCVPKPAQKDLPLFFGLKMNDENAKKIATYGHGWIPIKTSTDFINEGAKKLCEAFKENDREEHLEFVDN